MSWLLDSNIFIQAANDYYHFGICPGFWDWLLQHTSEVRSVEKVQEEILAKEDDLATWCKDKLPDGFFITPDEGIYQRLREITDYVKALPSPYDLKKKNKFLSGADTMLCLIRVICGLEKRKTVFSRVHLVISKLLIVNCASF